MERAEWYQGTELISQIPEILSPSSPEAIAQKIRTDSDLKTMVEDLNRAKAIDVKAYRRMKTKLPYVVTSKFEGDIRHSDRFEYALYWVIDLDHCLTTPAASRKLKDKIINDPLTHMMFVSPGGEGLKIFFHLDSPCTSATEYSAAYKAFANWYADYLELEGVVDLKTSDVARVCFLSYDPEVYFCPFPQKLEWRNYLPAAPTEKEATPERVTPVVDTEAITRIQQILNPQKIIRQREKQVFQPEQIKEIEQALIEAVVQKGVKVETITPLNYGLKLRAARHLNTGEVNIFYGKKGFSVVMSPKSGTSPELNQLLYETVADLLMI